MRCLLVLLALTTTAAVSEDRRDLRYEPTPGRKLALVAGNAAYPKWPLRNPLNDARAMQTALAELGFETDVLLNATRPDLERAIDRFAARVQPGDIALVYYAGHGIQVDGENYLVPVDFDAKDEADAKYLAYNASRLEERLERAGARLSILVLDACRNNPFRQTRSAGGGLAAMNTGKGALVAFATAPGKTADDNAAGANGLFTSHLVRALREPGLSLDQVFNRVRERVYAESGERQLPWTVSSVIGEFYFRGGTAAAPAPPPAPAQVPLSTALSSLTGTSPAPAVPQSEGASFALAHHHTLTGVHPAVLRLSAAGLAYDDQGHTSVCNQRPLQVPWDSVVSAAVTRSNRNEVFLNLKLRGDDGKIRNFNFADSQSTVVRNDGVPLVLSPPAAEASLQAIADRILAARKTQETTRELPPPMRY
ncbi:MAG: caspase family protein [Bryobacterales bacterium]|nr:caspase family protein [Bryobacterales bacterium]